MINDSKFMKETSHLLLQPSRPTAMRRSSSLNILEGYPTISLSRHRTSSLSFKEKTVQSTLRKRPSERNFNEIDEIRHLEWSYRKQDIDFPSSSVALTVVSPKGKRYDTSFLENPEVLCRAISGVLKGYIETASRSEADNTPKGHRYNIFERSPSTSSPSKPGVEIIDLSKIMNPASQILEKRKFKRHVDTPSLNEIFKFIHHIYQETQMERECLIIALVYIERALYGTTSENNSSFSETSSACSTPPPCRTPSPGILSDGGTDSPCSVCSVIETLTLSTANWKAVVITALLLASKIWDDFSMVNSDFATICYHYGCNVDVQRINELEKSFLVALDYRVFVKGPEYSQVYFRLQEIIDRLRGWLSDKNSEGKRRRQSTSPASATAVATAAAPHMTSLVIPPSPLATATVTPTTTPGNDISLQSSMTKENVIPLQTCFEDFPQIVKSPLQTNESSQKLTGSGIVMETPVPIGTLMSRNLFESIYSWIDDQLITPTPQSSTSSPSKTSVNGQQTPELQISSSPSQYYNSSEILYSSSSPFVSTHRRRAYSTPASIAPPSLPFSTPTLATSLSESVSTSDLFGALLLAEGQQLNDPNLAPNTPQNNAPPPNPSIIETVLGVFENGIKQYQQATQLDDKVSPDLELPF
jgi:hypothetical protein